MACSSRFPSVSDEEINILINDSKSKNTIKQTSWSVGVFEAWRIVRNTNGENIPDILDMSDNELNAWLARFCVECRRNDGKEFPPNSLYQIFCGLQRHLADNGKDKKIMNTENKAYNYFHNALNAKCADLTKKGIGIHKKKADSLSLEDEQLLWSKRVFSDDTAQNLIFIVYYYNCKLFGLRGRDEHKELTTQQFIVTDDTIEFLGRTSKSYNGGIKQIKLDPKRILHHDSPTFQISQYYKQYLELVGNGPFYKKPLENLMNSIRFGKQPVGVNTLAKYIPRICALGGLKGNFTSHTGKVSTVTQLKDAGVSDELIQIRSGHRSLSTLQMYKRSNEAENINVSSSLNPNVTNQSVKKNEISSVSEFLKNDSEDKFLADVGSKFEMKYCTFNIGVVNITGKSDSD